MRGFRFRSRLKKWPVRKACVLTSMMAGYWLSYFLRFHRPRYPGYHVVFSRGFAARVLGPRPTKLVVARKNKPLVPRVSRSMKTQKNLGKYPAITLINNACFSRGSLFKTWPKPETAHEKPLAHRVGARRSQGQSKRKKSEANIPPSWSNKHG